MDIQILITIPLEELQMPVPVVILDILHPVIIVTNVEISLETLVREQ